jgi:hypothetical protein
MPIRRMTEAKISTKTGYFMAAKQPRTVPARCRVPICRTTRHKQHLHDLIEMAESRAEEVDRITCEEEERVSRGFEIQHLLLGRWRPG